MFSKKIVQKVATKKLITKNKIKFFVVKINVYVKIQPDTGRIITILPASHQTATGWHAISGYIWWPIVEPSLYLSRQCYLWWLLYTSYAKQFA